MREIPYLGTALEVLLIGSLLFLAVLLILCLVRAILGPRVADRLVAVNSISTMVMVIISILTLFLEEGFLADVCLIYAMISFLAVIVLNRVYTSEMKKKDDQEEEENHDSN